MNAKNKVKVMAALLLIAAFGMMIPVASESGQDSDELEAEAFEGVEAMAVDKTSDYIFQVAISLGAILFTIIGMLYIVHRMKNETRRV